MTTARVLVVDDNEQNLELAKFLLEAAGFDVEPVTDPTRVVAIATARPPDLVLMDVQLPGTDGLTLTRLLKQDDRTRHVPVIAFTAHAMKGDEARMLAAGCNGYIAKPLDVKTFATRIRDEIARATLRT